MIIKVISVTYQIKNKKREKYATNFVYGRELYVGYDIKAGDFFDQEILNCITNDSNADVAVQPHYVMNQEFEINQYKLKFSNQIKHPAEIKIRPINTSENAQVKRQYGLANTTIQNLKAFWIDKREVNDPILGYLPEFYIDMDFREHNKIRETICFIND